MYRLKLWDISQYLRQFCYSLMSALFSYLDVVGAGEEVKKDTDKSCSNEFKTVYPDYS